MNFLQIELTLELNALACLVDEIKFDSGLQWNRKLFTYVQTDLWKGKCNWPYTGCRRNIWKICNSSQQGSVNKKFDFVSKKRRFEFLTWHFGWKDYLTENFFTSSDQYETKRKKEFVATLFLFNLWEGFFYLQHNTTQLKMFLSHFVCFYFQGQQQFYKKSRNAFFY